MNFPPQHSHSNSQEGAAAFAQQVLRELLASSMENMHSGTRDDIENLKRYYEEKVYLSYAQDSMQYLQHMLHKAQNSTQDYVLSKVRERQFGVIADIKANKYTIQKVKEEDKIQKIRDQLAHKISDIKNSMSNMETEHLEQQTQETYKKMMEFRQKGYWKQDSEQNQQVKKFLKRMKKEQKQLQQQHHKQMDLMERNLNQRDQQGKKSKEDELKRAQNSRIQKIQRTKEQREKQAQQKKRKNEQANALVKKYQNGRPVYLINAERFKNQILLPMEEERKRKLSEWKKTKKPIDVQELELHQQWYEEFKEAHNQATNKKEQDLELQEKNMQKLNELFHGRFHQKITKERNPLHMDLQNKKQQKEKIKSYSVSVREEHRPIEDPKKKQEMESIVKLLEKKKLSGRKIIQKEDGSVTYEEVTPQQRHMIGVSYLDHLRQFNAGRKKITSQQKTKNFSVADISQKPVYHDYLRQQRASSQSTAGELRSRNNLRKLINSQGAFTRDRYQSSMDHLVLLENQAKRKQTQLKYMRGGQRSMELKSELDQYYIQSAYLNLKMLKEVVQK